MNAPRRPAGGNSGVQVRRYDLVDDLIALIGADGYLRLAQAMGGAMFYVPRSPGADHDLTRAIGADLAARVAEYYHGVEIVLPMGDYRRRAIQALAQTGGLSGDDIARQLRLPRSSVYAALKSLKSGHGRPAAPDADERQMALFSPR